MLQVGIAEEVTFERDLPADVSDVDILDLALKRYVAGDVMSAERGSGVVGARADGCADLIQLDISVVGGDVDRGLHAGDRDGAVVGVDGRRGRFGENEHDIRRGAIHRRHRDGEDAARKLNTRVELLALGFDV